MPPPIVPAPMIATLLDRRASACLPARRESCDAARSAKKAWRSAFDSRASASAPGRARARTSGRRRTASSSTAATASTHFSGAGKLLRHRADGVARELEEGLGVRVLDLRGRAPLGSGRCAGDFSRANAIAPSSRSPSIISSNSFVPRQLRQHLAGTGSPETIMLSAVSTPSTRGSRCVPPAPGHQAELHLGQRDLRAGGGDAVVAAERELEAAAHATLCDRGDDRLRRSPRRRAITYAGSARRSPSASRTRGCRRRPRTPCRRR